MTGEKSDAQTGREADASTRSAGGDRSGPGGLDVLRVASDIYPDVLGGGALHVHEMSRLQAAMGHDVTVLTSDHGNREAPRQEERAGYELRRYRQFGRPFGNSLMPGMLRDLRGQATRADLVHAHSHLYFSTNLAAVVARFTDTPLVITNHGLHSQSAPMPVQKVYAPIARFTFNSADRVFCYTETDRERLRDRGVTAPVAVVHNGIDCETFTPDAATGERPRVLFVGRLKESKGVRRILEAFIEIGGGVPTATLTFVGEGPLREALEARTKEAGLSDRVTFTGRLDNDDLPEIYAASAVFALPSRFEGFPRTVLEAMACGTPPVTSDLPQLVDVVERVGETVPPGDVDALADVLQGLLREPDRRARLGRAARDHVVKEYSWTETVRQTTDVCRELVDESEEFDH